MGFCSLPSAAELQLGHGLRCRRLLRLLQPRIPLAQGEASRMGESGVGDKTVSRPWQGEGMAGELSESPRTWPPCTGHVAGLH